MVIHCFLKRSKGVVGHVSRMPYGQPMGERYQVLAMARLDSEKGVRWIELMLQAPRLATDRAAGRGRAGFCTPMLLPDEG